MAENVGLSQGKKNPIPFPVLMSWLLYKPPLPFIERILLESFASSSLL